jgi:multidrug resistance efflux pump
MKKVSIPLAQRLGDLLRGPIVLLVWLGCAAVAGWIMLQRPAPLTHTVWVPPVLVEVKSPADGRVEVLSVHQSQLVRRGDVIGRLDDAALTARLETELARVEEMRARVMAAEARAASELETAIREFELDRADEFRRYAGDLPRYTRDEANLALDVLALEVQIALDLAEIERIVVRWRRAEALAERDAGPVAEVEDLALLQAQFQADLETTRTLLARTRVERDAATARLEAFVAARPVDVPAHVQGDSLSGVRAAVEVQLLAVAEVRVALAGLRLIAPLDGHIHALHLTDGQTVLAGDPVVRIVAEGADEAVLFLDPESADLDLVGRQVELRRPRRVGRMVKSTVISIAPHVELMPERLWLAPDQPRYGRAARVRLGEGHPFVPGEVLGVRLLN